MPSPILETTTPKITRSDDERFAHERVIDDEGDEGPSISLSGQVRGESATLLPEAPLPQVALEDTPVADAATVAVAEEPHEPFFDANPAQTAADLEASSGISDFDRGVPEQPRQQIGYQVVPNPHDPALPPVMEWKDDIELPLFGARLLSDEIARSFTVGGYQMVPPSQPDGMGNLWTVSRRDEVYEYDREGRPTGKMLRPPGIWLTCEVNQYRHNLAFSQKRQEESKMAGVINDYRSAAKDAERLKRDPGVLERLKGQWALHQAEIDRWQLELDSRREEQWFVPLPIDPRVIAFTVTLNAPS